MMQLRLSMRYSRHRQRETVAWLVPGADAEVWLDEISRWGVSPTAIVCRVISDDAADVPPKGIVVTVSSVEIPHVSRRCQQYGCIGDRFYLPANAVLEPEALDSEITPLLSADDDYVFHPSRGLVRFESRELLRVADLIQPPEVSDTDWNWAQPGVAICDRLRSVTPEETLSVEALLQIGGGDIASQDPTSAPGGSKGLGGAIETVKRMLGIGDPDARHVNQFLKLLEKDPDEALRFAVPLKDQTHRGTSPNAGGLFRRKVDFSLPQLGGGRPGSACFVPSNVYERLQTHYRRLAQREIELGRHRRAAYVFAHLLDDLRTAASCLVSGRHFREAAILYRDKLNQPVQAAVYLEQAGMWAEAIELYEKLGNFEKVGELYRNIDQPEEAERAYRRAVDQRLKSNDILGAANLLEEQLDSPDEAFTVCRRAWPDHPQAESCLREQFRILKQKGVHEESGKLIHRVADCPLSDGAAVKAVKVLAQQAIEYPDREVGALAADTVRLIAAEKLPDASRGLAAEMLKQLKQLVPADRLLKRDCSRYPSTRPNKPIAAGSPVSERSQQPFSILRKPDLPHSVTWMTAASNRVACYLAGYRGEQELVVARLNWTILDQQPDLVDVWQKLDWTSRYPPLDIVESPIRHSLFESPILLCPASTENQKTLIHVRGSSPIGTKRLRITVASPVEEYVGGHEGFSRDDLAVATSPDGLIWTASPGDGEIVLRCYDREEHLVSSQQIPVPDDVFSSAGSGREWLPMAATRSHLYLGLQQYLLCITRGVGAEVVRTNSEIVKIEAPPEREDFLPYVMMTCEKEVSLVRHQHNQIHIETLSDDTLDPVVGITRNRALVIFEEKQFTIYDRSPTGFRRISVQRHNLGLPLVVVTASHRDRLLVIGKTSQFHLLEIH